MKKECSCSAGGGGSQGGATGKSTIERRRHSGAGQWETLLGGGGMGRGRAGVGESAGRYKGWLEQGKGKVQKGNNWGIERRNEEKDERLRKKVQGRPRPDRKKKKITVGGGGRAVKRTHNQKTEKGGQKPGWCRLEGKGPARSPAGDAGGSLGGQIETREEGSKESPSGRLGTEQRGEGQVRRG